MCVDESVGRGKQGCGMQVSMQTWAISHLWAQQEVFRRSTSYQPSKMAFLHVFFSLDVWLLGPDVQCRTILNGNMQGRVLKYSHDGFPLLMCTRSCLYSLIARCPRGQTLAIRRVRSRNLFELCFHCSPSVPVNVW